MSKIQTIFLENPEFYADKKGFAREDNIIITFLLYEAMRSEKSEWFHLISNLPRDIDILCFWNNNELDLLNDPKLK